VIGGAFSFAGWLAGLRAVLGHFANADLHRTIVNHRLSAALQDTDRQNENTMAATRILQASFAGFVALMCVGTPGYTWDAAQGARDSIIQGVRDDVRRKIQAREQQRYRDSRAEYRNGARELRKRKVRIR